ncbi:acyl esterase [Acinetobacter sp. VNH17]|uniref:Acyl esterase n=1 Tax=Acinetobacter thutiue TaxID=2998078 RepID=A0ABT7WSP8_9GAMM|nr:acyl esterase [Acinetobacter thutiue]MCY6413591.1 acyl esterase [Acinetobacter thutiue]MDN0015700.1 acyl esterase [Acinetobacter thutiue]
MGGINSPQKISKKDLIFAKKYTFCTLVTRFDEYLEMVESAKNAGFDGSDIEFLYFDNNNSNEFDGYTGINHALLQAKGEYLIFCHQDILFSFDDRQILDHRIAELNQINVEWAVVGNAGRDQTGRAFTRITDPYGANQKAGNFPHEVMSLDENFLVINRKQNIACSSLLSGFHLYATDLCQNAQYLGLRNYVIDFHLYHKSSGNIDQNYMLSKKRYIYLQQKRKKAQFYSTCCSIFFVSSNSLLTYLFNKKILLKWLRSFYKRLGNLQA